MSEWISINDRLPPKYMDVLVCIQREHTKLGSYKYINLTWINTDNGDWDVCGFRQDEDRDFVTHWMPLPKPPSEED